MHIRQYLEVGDFIPDDMADALKSLQGNPSPQLMEELENDQTYVDFMSRYMAYRQETLEGLHGSTARYWMTYSELVHVFHLFNRGYRTNDLDLFIYALDIMCEIFFAVHRPNYSRWMVLYVLRLLNIEHSHPGLRQVLEQGAFSIRRTTKPFSRSAVDITLEQTVNCDAASRRTGIASFSNATASRSRWMITHAVRSSIVANLMAKAGINPTEDSSKELKHHRQKRDSEDLQKIIKGFEATMNPFTIVPDENLYCITSGKKVRDDIKDDLLNIQAKGHHWCEEFREGCFGDPEYFQKPIPRRKVKNFACAAAKSKAPAKSKIKELQCSRDLFGRLLFLSTKASLDLQNIFAHPLTPVPLSLAHIDGSMNKTNKAKLMHHLEIKATTNDPTHVSVTVVDAMFYLHCLVDAPLTYGEIASRLLHQLCSLSERVDLVTDCYTSPSLKDVERERRGLNETIYNINGPDQKRPIEWQKSLQSPSFKSSLMKFLSSEWQRPCYAACLSGHRLFLALDERCYCFRAIDGAVLREEVPLLSCKHEEADTRIIFHLQHIIQENGDAHVVIRANDTDIFILLAHHLPHFQGSHSVWMDAGHSSTNTRRFINMTSIVHILPRIVCEALPGLHAFTGSDFTASFLNKGKIRPYEIMCKSAVFTACFADLGANQGLSDDEILGTPIEHFVCSMYGRAKITNVNEARLALFQQNYAPQSAHEPLEKIKGSNPSCIPPCRKVLVEKVRRANLVASIWKNATRPNPSNIKPEENGWLLIEGKYYINWFNGDMVPQQVWQVLEGSYIPDQEDSDQEINEPEDYIDIVYGPDEDLDGEIEDIHQWTINQLRGRLGWFWWWWICALHKIFDFIG